jgi:hypothetical protein
MPLVRRASAIFEELWSTCPDLPDLRQQCEEGRRLQDGLNSGPLRQSP